MGTALMYGLGLGLLISAFVFFLLPLCLNQENLKRTCKAIGFILSFVGILLSISGNTANDDAAFYEDALEWARFIMVALIFSIILIITIDKMS